MSLSSTQTTFVPKPGECFSAKYDILPPRAYNTENRQKQPVRQNLSFRSDETLPIIRENQEPQRLDTVENEINSIWQELHQIRSNINNNYTNLTEMIQRNQQEIESLRCLLRSKDREIAQLRSDLYAKEKLVLQLQNQKETLTYESVG